jgi:hypothetical protein
VATEALTQPPPAPAVRARRPRPSLVVHALVSPESEASAEPDAARVPRRRRWTRGLRIAGGWIIFGVGVVFVILPVIPGTPLVILSAVMLAPDVPLFARILDRSKSRYPHIAAGVADVRQRFTEDFHRRFAS